MATFTMQHTGLVTLAAPFTTPFTGSTYVLSRLPLVAGARPDFIPTVVDGGYTYTWREDPDYPLCPQDYDMTIAHPR